MASETFSSLVSGATVLTKVSVSSAVSFTHVAATLVAASTQPSTTHSGTTMRRRGGAGDWPDSRLAGRGRQRDAPVRHGRTLSCAPARGQ